MESVALVPALWGIAGLVRPLLVPLAICWGFARVILGVSLRYLGQCVYLELLHKVRSGVSSAPKEKPSRPKLSPEERAAKLRGVEVQSAASYTTSGQSLPPTKRVSALFPAGEMPAGELLDFTRVSARDWWHFGRAPREDATVGPEQDDAWLERRQCLREGAEVHRQVRQYVQQKVRPGMELREIAEMVEFTSSALVGYNPESPLARGWAFPTGISVNEVAAHDTVNPGDPPRWLKPGDIVKLDFGVHIKGHILDSAFTLAFDPMHDELMQAVREATNEGIRHAGPDALVAEIGGCIREVMEAAEVHRADGKVLPVKAIKNLTGHSIGPYHIHAGKSLPSVNTGGKTRMLAGELWAVETFGSVGGLGYVGNLGNCSHFMRPDSAQLNMLQRAALSQSALRLFDMINQRFDTLAFCPRWLVQAPSVQAADQRWWSAPLGELCNIGVVRQYPPLADLPGSYTAQYEHTILLGSRGKEVLTRGPDF